MDEEIRRLTGALRRLERVGEQNVEQILDPILVEIGPETTKGRRSLLLAVMRAALTRYMRTFRDDACCPRCSHPAAWHHTTPYGEQSCSPPANTLQVTKRGGLVFKKGAGTRCACTNLCTPALEQAAADFAEPVSTEPAEVVTTSPADEEVDDDPPVLGSEAFLAMEQQQAALEQQNALMAQLAAAAVRAHGPVRANGHVHDWLRWAWGSQGRWVRSCRGCDEIQEKNTCPRCRTQLTPRGARRCACCPTLATVLHEETTA